MTWIEHHRVSEVCATQAEALLREGRCDEARQQYALAAEAEERALEAVDSTKPKTYGITAVSAASLHFKARQMEQAGRVAMRSMRSDQLPVFARHQLQSILRDVWAQALSRKDAAGGLRPPGGV